MSTVSPRIDTFSQIAGIGDYFSLLKPRVMVLVVFTAGCGLVAAPGDMPLTTALASLLAVAMGAGAAGAINMWHDYDIDARMRRTARRAIPDGRVARDEALGLGLLLSCLALTLMALAGGPLATILLAVSIAFYGVIYTILLKRRTDQNIVIGGAAGAFPPVIGWAAATGEASVQAWLLFAIIFFWTPPHFWALSLWTRKDYADAGIPMLPVTRGVRSTRAHILAYTLILGPIAVMPAIWGQAGTFYLGASVLLGLGFLGFALRLCFSRAGETAHPDAMRHARRMFWGSNGYLALIFASLVLDTILVSVWGIGA